MSHTTLKSGYAELVERLNRFPQGAPPSDTLYKILQILFSEREAQLVSLLPIKPFTAEKASQVWNLDLTETRKVLDELSSRAIKVLGELFYQYLNVEEDFVRELFTQGQTQLGRVFVHEPVLSTENALHVLDYERASEVIQTARHRGIGVCYCRHKMQHVGRNCDAPMDICMTFNGTAQSLTRHGYARPVGVSEGLDLLQQAYERNLVQFGENARESVNFICNCCGCCCEALIAARKFGTFNPVHTSNFLPVVDETACNGCGKCVSICPVEAMTLVSTNDPHHPKMKKAKLADDICLGCGVCVRTCSHTGLSLRSRPQRVITPLNTVHRTVVMAIERGDFQHLLFDNRVLWNHRALAAVLGVVLRLPPIQQAMASQQVKSQYMEYLVTHLKV